MRVISGIAGGRRLKTLEGDTTRPTTDKVKEALFNIIQCDVSGADVLDLFAGSGALGIEAISRGAASAVFVDISRHAQAIIRENIDSLGFGDKTRLIVADSVKFLKETDFHFDLIFIDPPYAAGLYDPVLTEIARRGILKRGGTLCIEYNKTVSFEIPPEYEVIKTKQYGSIFLLFARIKEDDNGNSYLPGQF